MATQHLHSPNTVVMSDPEWIALESIDEQLTRFIFNDAMLCTLRKRGLAEPRGESWQVTPHGREALIQRAAC